MGQPLVRLPGMVERMASYFGGEAVLTPAHLKMAEGPQHADLIDYKLADGNASKFPILKINNIYVLPGAAAAPGGCGKTGAWVIGACRA